jgi:hypothetical protein
VHFIPLERKPWGLPHIESTKKIGSAFLEDTSEVCTKVLRCFFPVISLLGIYPKDLRMCRSACGSVFTQRGLYERKKGDTLNAPQQRTTPVDDRRRHFLK